MGDGEQENATVKYSCCHLDIETYVNVKSFAKSLNHCHTENTRITH